MKKFLAVLGFALLMWSANANAVAVDKVRVLEGSSGCAISSSTVMHTAPPIDIVYVPTSVVKLAADTTGMAWLFPVYASINILVKHAAGSSASLRLTGGSGGPCGYTGLSPLDVTNLFQPGPNTVEITVTHGGTDGLGYRAGWPTLYLVATQGHILSAQGTQA